MKPKRDWQILLLGGASGVGKSRLSYPLARHYQTALTEIDDFQVILETLTTPEQQPLLHFWRTDWETFASWSDQERLEHFIRVTREVFQPALKAVIANHLESQSPLILEGDFLLPEFALQASLESEGKVKAIFICENDKQQIAANYLSREGQEQSSRAHSSWIFNQWLRSECLRLDLPLLPSRPWESTLERAIALLDKN